MDNRFGGPDPEFTNWLDRRIAFTVPILGVVIVVLHYLARAG